MKKIFVLLFVFLSGFSFLRDGAYGYELEKRHLSFVIEEVQKACGKIDKSQFQIVSHEKEIQKIDQGQWDAIYRTQLLYNVKVDQGVFDRVLVRLMVQYYDYYDHDKKDWGVYELLDIECEIK